VVATQALPGTATSLGGPNNSKVKETTTNLAALFAILVGGESTSFGRGVQRQTVGEPEAETVMSSFVKKERVVAVTFARHERVGKRECCMKRDYLLFSALTYHAE
jgi:hypothetical protein